MKLANSTPRVGDWVLAVGNPFGLGGTVTAGIVSARGRDIGAGPYDDFIQIDAPVNKGNSGGPTFDVDGNVIGVNTAIYSPSGGSVGIAFAIPAEHRQERDRPAARQRQRHPRLDRRADSAGDAGHRRQHGPEEGAGALVAEPQPNSPAMKAGIKSGDVITAVNGTPVRDARELARRIGTMAPGTSVALDLIHDGQQKTVTLTLGTLPNEQVAKAEPAHPSQSADIDVPKLGFKLAPATSVSGSSSKGVVVTAISEGGVAADHGLQVGDVILDVGGKAVTTPDEFNKSSCRCAQGRETHGAIPGEVGRGHKVCGLAARQRLSNGAIRRHLSPPLAGVPWGRTARSVPAEYQLYLPVSVAPAGVELVEGVAAKRLAAPSSSIGALA